ncbi:MAG TPA: hypothetical protein VIH57_00775 [Bacteroidales bacterium]|jgi:hypothetical protein
MIGSFIFCFSYKDEPGRFFDDLRITLRLFTFQAFISIFVYILFHPFVFYLNIRAMPYYSICYSFYYFLPEDGFLRITGLFWEPGCLQLIANLYLFLCIINNARVRSLLWPAIVVICTFSTAGFILLSLNAIYYVLKNFKLRRMKLSIIVVLLLSIGIFPIVYQTVHLKLNKNLSGMIRQVNTISGLMLLINHPLVGVDMNVDALVKNPEFNKIQEELWGINSEMLPKKLGSVAGGFTNGFLGLLLKWGIPIGLLMYYLFYKSVFFPNSNVAFYFLFLFLVTNMSEALTDTSLFYVFALSTVVFGIRSQNNVLFTAKRS